MFTTAPNCRNSKLNPSWNAAARKHYRAAVRLWAQAERLYSEQEVEGAAELIYMAAKRTINAVANSRSRDPITTRAKYRQLKRIVQDTPEGEQLLPLWEAACRLHAYADQTPERAILDRDWRLAAQFIARMLSILLTDTAPDAPDGSR